VISIRFYPVLVIALLASCSITKRHYRAGFYIQRHTDYREIISEKKPQNEIDQNEKGIIAMNDVIQEQMPEPLLSAQSEFKSREKYEIPAEPRVVNKVECKLKRPVTSFIIQKRVLPHEPVFEDNVELAEWYLGRANRYTLLTILLGWSVLGLFIFGPLALNRAKRAIFLNDKAVADIDITANRDIKVVKIYFTAVSLLLLLSLFIVLVTL
jgi:hypothetical protein